MKLGIVLANGLEGWGVTQFTLQQQKFLKEKGHNVTIFSAPNSFHKNRDSQGVVENLVFFDLDKEYNFDSFDLIIINSLPYERKSLVLDQCLGWKKTIENTKTPIVLIQHDHSRKSISKTINLSTVIEKAKVIFSLSTKSYFANIVGSNNLSQFLGGPKVYSFQPGIKFDGLKKLYWKDINEQDPLHHKWIGRTTPWKGYDLMCQWSSHLLPQGYTVSLEGMDASPPFIPIKRTYTFENKIKDKTFIPEPNKLNIFGSYKNVEMLERMSKCGFGYQLSLLKSDSIEYAIEYTHQEIVCCGVIPVFRKEYGERCLHRITGDPLFEHKNTGTIWLNSETFDSSITTIKKLVKDSVLRNETREMAFEFYREHQDATYTFSNIHNIINQELNMAL